MAAPPSPSPRFLAILRRSMVGFGLLCGAWMVARSQVGGDQLNLLARGWLLTQGTVVPYGNPLSTGGAVPGSLTSLLVGLPLLAWRDFRAPVVLVFLGHVAAYGLLDRLVAGRLGEPSRTTFALVYWLNPWRLYHAAFLWNPNLLFPLAACHLVTAWRMRSERRPAATALHVVALGLAAQLHPSALLLIVASGLLWWRRRIQVHWPGLWAGAGAILLSLVPWLLATRAHPEVIASEHGFPLRGLLLLFPFLRGMLYWLRFGSLDGANTFFALDFSTLVAPRWDHALRSLAVPLRALGVASVALSLFANLRLWRHHWRFAGWRRPPEPEPLGEAAWLASYCRLSFVATALVCALSLTTIMSWQLLVGFHAAALTLVLAVRGLARSRRRRWLRPVLGAWLAGSIALALLMAAGGPNYRCAGHGAHRSAFSFPLAHDHPMLDELGIQQACPWPVNDPGTTWWPDVLPVE